MPAIDPGSKNRKSVLEYDDLQEDFNKRFGEHTLDDLTKLLDGYEEQEYRKWEHMRLVASEMYDFTGFDHINCYTKENYISGVLEALENTRRQLSIKTAEDLIDFLWVFGYSLKRIIYILFTQKYTNWNRRDVQNYINRNKYRLNKEREELRRQMENAVTSVFQGMKADVMKAEKETLHIYLNNITKLQKELESIDIIAEAAKFDRVSKQLDKYTDKVKAMHGIDALREATIEVGSFKAKENHKKALELGYMNEELEKGCKSLPGAGEADGSAIDTEVTFLE